MKSLLDTLAKYFERETIFSSRPETDHPYYKSIVILGKRKPDEVIPWLLERVDDNWHWPMALEDIVGDTGPSIPEEYAGQINFIADQWKSWGKDNGFIDT